MINQMEDYSTWNILFSTIVVLALAFVFHFYVALVIKPKKIRKILRQQGIDGPPPRIYFGNSLEVHKSRAAVEKAVVEHPHPPVIHNTASVYSYFEQWREQYGKVYTFSLGTLQIVYVSSPDVVKEIVMGTSWNLGRPSFQQKELRPLLGRGLLSSNGSIWARQRKLIAPQLFMDKVKGMMSIITESALGLINSWKREIEADESGIVDIAVDDYMRMFSGEIISRTCFGSSHSKGQEIFSKFQALQEIMSKKTFSIGIPGLRHVPTRSNIRMWALEREIRELILKVVKERRSAAGYEKDLLQTLLEGAKGTYFSSAAINQFVVDNCKNILSAGFETSAVSASWCLMLLASNLEWQTRVRHEVQEVCRGRIPDADMLPKMKLLNMVIQETMRLYPPTASLSREALKDVNVGDIRVPKGVHVWFMTAALHTDLDIWGPDAHKFKPERFENGIAGACKNQNSYIPFGFGQRVCIGQHLAMVELKLLMALILSNFSFTLSPNYVHSPVVKMTIRPKHGVKILIKKL